MRAQFVLSEIGVGLRRNLTMTFAVVVSVALSLALFGGSLLMSDQVSTMKGYWYDKVNVSIFLCNKSDAESDPHCAKGAVTAEQKDQILGDLKKMAVVEKVSYESSDQAYKHYKEQFGDSPLASSLTPDQMQESYRIKLKDPQKYQVIATAFDGRDGVQSVQDQKGILDNLFGLLNGMNWAARAVMAMMLVVALMLIVNTVRLGVQPAAGNRHHAARGRLRVLHPGAVHHGGRGRRTDRRGRRLRIPLGRTVFHHRSRPRAVPEAESDQLHRLGRRAHQAAAHPRDESADARACGVFALRKYLKV